MAPLLFANMGILGLITMIGAEAFDPVEEQQS
jgi:hypothetical protein